MQKFKSLQELFRNKKRWTQGALARTKGRCEVLSDCRYATCWCLIGACEYVYGDGAGYVIEKLRETLKRRFRRRDFSIIHWQDDPTRTIDDVRRLVKEAGV